MANPSTAAEQEFRQGLLDLAYYMDGRDNPDHPYFATYTALSTTDAYQQCLKSQATPSKTSLLNGGERAIPMPLPSTMPPPA